MTDADVWAGGALTLQAAAEYLGRLCDKTVRRIASAEKWPSKLVGGRRVYPASLVRAYLAACPAAVTTRPGRKERVG